MTLVNTNTFPSTIIKIATPSGTLYMIVVEDHSGSVTDFQLTIGKAGSELNAWVNALALIMTLAVRKGITLDDLKVTLSGITGDKPRSISNARSGPEGVWMALMKYTQSPRAMIEHDDSDDGYRGASVGPGARVRSR